MNHLDLFSGIGGFSLAAKWAGINTIQFVEIDSFCQKVLKKNFPNVPIHDDIKTFHYDGHVDLLTGGFPCQGFSNAGKKRGRNDNRYLWPEMLRIITQCHPAWIIAENVIGIVEMELDNILDDLEKEGYEVQSFVIPACAAYAPHRRDRLWIIANAMQKRCDDGIYYWQARSIPKDKKWDLATLQQEWAWIIPDTWTTLTARDWLQYNAKLCRRNNGLSQRLDKDRMKSLGNAIVPQVVYPMIRMIKMIEGDKND